MTAPRNNDFVGRIFSDRYRLTRKVGEGAMGQVYLARHTFMDKNVAVKVLHPELWAHEEVVERFQREAKAAAHIEHPNVCAATDFGRDADAGLFLVMEWLDGDSLEQRIEAAGTLDVETTVHIGIQVAEALERAHELKIVHRDLKPANIMLIQRDGDPNFVKVTDFGVARVPIGNSAKLTQAGMAYGTPSYMAPEQATGEDVDQRTDVYALGITLYEMLTGKVPFEGASVAHVLSKHVTEPPPPLSQHTTAPIPAALEAVIMRCLSKTPADRFSTAADVSDALRAIRDGVQGETAAIRIEPSMRSTEWAIETAHEIIDDVKRRPPKVLAAIGAVVVVLVGVAVAIGLSAGAAVEEKVVEAKQATLAEERAEFARQPEIRQALELQAQGKQKEAVSALRSAELNYQTNPHFHFLLATALVQSGGVKDALGSFQKATDLQPDYSKDPGLQKAIVDAATMSDAREAVVAFVKSHGDDGLRTALVTQTREASDRKDRANLVGVLKDSGAMAKLGRADQLDLEIRGTRGCKELKPLVDEALKRSDNDFTVQYLDDLPTRGCGFLNRSDCYDCIRDDVEKAAAARGLRGVTSKEDK